MKATKKLLMIFATVYCALLLSLVGCATPTKPVDVGQVVVAPRPVLPAFPSVVKTTEPKPAGYFQKSLLDYSNGSSSKPTK